MANPFQIYQFLPKTNCKECGEKTCMAFAVKLISQEAKIEQCPYLEEDKKKEIEKIVKPFEGAEKTGLVIHDELCTGCGNCVVACPVNVANDPHGVATGRGSKNEKLILRVKDGTVHACDIENCRRFVKPRVLCDVCVVLCPKKAIEFP
jgi:4Fe-4S ferredoxin